MEWRHVDLKAGEIRLEPGTTKNREGRVFKMTTQLRKLLEEQRDERDRLTKLEKICPYLFFRMVADKGSTCSRSSAPGRSGRWDS